jgi:hypothetical protein
MEDQEPPATLLPMSRVSRLILVLGGLLLSEAFSPTMDPGGICVEACPSCSAKSVLRFTFSEEEEPKGLRTPLRDVGLEFARFRSRRLSQDGDKTWFSSSFRCPLLDVGLRGED